MSLTIHDIPRTRSLRWRILIPLTCLTVFFTSLGSLAVHIVMLQNVHGKIAIIGCILGVCVISIATGAWCQIRHYVLVPLSDLQRVIFLRAAGQADVYAPFLVEGEVGDLARTYNEMLAMLREHEGSLKVAHDNFMKFFDLSVDCLCVLDSSGAFLTANETMLSRLGYSMEELRDQSVLQVHPPKRHAEAMRIVQEMLAGTVDVCRIPLQTKDGSLMPVETRIVQGEWDGKPALFGISRDISELALSEERFSKAFHISATMKAISTLRDGRFNDVNEAFLKGLDVTREEVVGHCSAEFNFFPLKEIRNILLKKFEKAGRLVNEEVDFLNSAGQLRHGLFSMDSLAMGGEPCILTSMTDITERKRAERELEDYRRALEQRVAERTIALRKSEQLFHFLFEHMQQGVVYHDADGRITMVNPAAEQILGMTLDQMQGRDSADDGWNAISESGLPLPGSGHPSMIALRSGCCVEDFVMGIQNAEKGDRRWLLVNAVPEFQDGEKQPFRVFTTFTDITARKSATEQLIQAQKLESVGRLAGGIAHDFNNNLYCILGFSELVLEALPPNSQHRGHVTQIQQAARQAADITKQLLAFSRRQVLIPRPSDINVLIRNEQKFLRRLIGEDIRVELDLCNESAIAVVDPSQFLQVLMNLCVNARDAMPEGGVLTLETEMSGRVSPPADLGKGAEAYIRMMVTDTGVGMSDEILANIFEPFFTTKEPGKGTGLGLPVIHGIVRQHGGWIEVKSRVGSGSRFSVYLPSASQEHVDASPEHVPVVPQGKGEVIMLVEDHSGVRSIAAQRLRRLGYRVIDVGSCAQARERFFAEPHAIDLLLSDVVLPDGTGTGLAAEFIDIRADMKVAMVSGYSDEKSCHEEIIARGWAFLPKPHSAMEVATLLNSLFTSPRDEAVNLAWCGISTTVQMTSQMHAG